MTEAVLDTLSAAVQTPLDSPLVEAGANSLAVSTASPGTPTSRLQEYIRAGKFSPAVAAQLHQVLNSDGAQPLALSPVAPPSEFFILEMASNLATGCVLAILALGAIALSIAFAGLIDNYLLVVAGLIFMFLTLAVVALGSLNQAPPKPRPPKPVKAAKPKRVKEKPPADSPAQPAAIQPAP